MKRILPTAALLALCSMTAEAGLLNLHLTATTDGNRYGQMVDEFGNSMDTTEFGVGAFQLSELMQFSFDVQFTDTRAINYPSGLVFHEFVTAFTPTQISLGNGLMAQNLAPNFTPNHIESSPTASASLQWLQTSNGSGLGSTLFQLGIGWQAYGTDEHGAFHTISYSRSYDFWNNALVTSLDDLGMFNEQLFEQLLADPSTYGVFNESVHTSTSGCADASLCGENGVRTSSLTGSFVFEPVTVPTPSTVLLLALALLLPLRRKAA